jgi:hypothetical protein
MPPEPADLCASVRLDLINACLGSIRSF